MKGLLRALVALPFLVAACSTPSETTAESTAASSPPPGAAAPSSATQGVVAGRVPTGGVGMSSIVVLQPKAPVEVPQVLPPVMDQVALTFIPGVLLVRTGHPVEFRNSDDVLHNVRVNEDATKAGTFNVAIPMGEDYRFTFEKEGFYNVGCDIHPAMSATIYVSPSPYATLSDKAGKFEIRDVPAGAYNAVVYAGNQRIERPVEVPPSGTEVDFTQ
jgi:plastocyanin